MIANLTLTDMVWTILFLLAVYAPAPIAWPLRLLALPFIFMLIVKGVA